MRAQCQTCTAIAYGLNAFQVFVQLNAVVGYVVCILLTGSYYYIAVTAYGCAVCIYGVNMSAVFSFAGNYAYVSACFNLGMLACFGCYFLQLLFGCSLTFTVSKASISSSFIAKSAYGCSSAIHDYISCCYTASCPDSSFDAADSYKSVRIISFKSNLIFQSNIILHMTICNLFRGYSNISTIGNSTVFECFFVYLLQLSHVDGIRIFSTCGNVSNLASDIVRRITHRNSSFGGSPSGFFCRRDGIRCKSSECSFFAASYSIRYRTYSDSYSALCSYRRTIPNSHRIICRNSIFISQRNHIFSTL